MKIFVLVFAAAIVANAPAARAQQTSKIPRIGYITTTFASEVTGRVDALKRGLRELGYVEDKNINIEYRYADGKSERLPGLVNELISLKIDVLVTHGFPPARAAKNATQTIPVVMAVIGDAVGAGLVTSLARPGGNITGFTSISSEMYGKRLELLKDVAPRISRVAVLSSETSPGTEIATTAIIAAANGLRLQVQNIRFQGRHDLDDAFNTASKSGSEAVMVLQGPITSSFRKRIIELAMKNKLLTAFHESEFTEAGGLMSYGVSYADMYRRTASYVDRILKGTKPADLPVQQATRFEFVINQKTAKHLGLTIPPNVLARADRVIK